MFFFRFCKKSLSLTDWLLELRYWRSAFKAQPPQQFVKRYGTDPIKCNRTKYSVTLAAYSKSDFPHRLCLVSSWANIECLLDRLGLDCNRPCRSRHVLHLMQNRSYHLHNRHGTWHSASFFSKLLWIKSSFVTNNFVCIPQIEKPFKLYGVSKKIYVIMMDIHLEQRLECCLLGIVLSSVWSLGNVFLWNACKKLSKRLSVSCESMFNRELLCANSWAFVRVKTITPRKVFGGVQRITVAGYQQAGVWGQSGAAAPLRFRLWLTFRLHDALCMKF